MSLIMSDSNSGPLGPELRPLIQPTKTNKIKENNSKVNNEDWSWLFKDCRVEYGEKKHTLVSETPMQVGLMTPWQFFKMAGKY